ncbi:MAG: prolyl oligopeptidase family serine peptidase [Oscillospiraceae bacterium]|nr:prolyl oligopeptidase family serine peptidase [Oscillospiraceae bacterium]
MALMHVDFFSNVLGMCMQMDVILPQKTYGQIGMEGTAEESYPTLYLLHGMSDDHTIWQRRTSIERYVSDRNLAVVMPSTHLGWYTDMAYGLPYFTYITKELPEICRSFFRGMSEKREDTYIAGLSMGGYGALKAALTRPETYCAAAALSAATDVFVRAQREDKSGRRHYWESIFGKPEQVPGSENDLFALAERCAKGGLKPELFQCCGTEDDHLEENRRLRDTLQTLGYRLQYREPQGGHSWILWDAEIQTVLNWIDEIRRRSPR